MHHDYEPDDGRPRRPGVTTEFLERNGICRVSADVAYQRVGYKTAGTLIPYRHFFANSPVVVNGKEFCRLRLDHASSNGTKYLAPKDGDSQLYIPSSPPFSTPELVICEGEFKALALSSRECAPSRSNGINAATTRQTASFA